MSKQTPVTRRSLLRMAVTGFLAPSSIMAPVSSARAAPNAAPTSDVLQDLSVLREMFPQTVRDQLAIVGAIPKRGPLNVVFSGGGIWGIALVGFLKKLEELHLNIAGLGGVSAGAIFAALYAGGYDATGLRDLALQTDFRWFFDGAGMDWIRGARQLVTHFGLNPGDRLEKWLADNLYRKNHFKPATFEQMRMDLRILTVDVTSQTYRVFEKLKYPESSVATAARMSAGIPFVYYPHPREGEERFVDGALVSNMPLWLFTDGATVGVRLVSSSKMPPRAPGDITAYSWALVQTVLSGRAAADIMGAEGRVVTIDVADIGIDITDFNIDRGKKQALIDKGYKAAETFFARYL